MTPIEMLERFARFADFDPERRDFAIPSRAYDMHRLIEKVARVSEYDPTGKLGVLYAKRSYLAGLESKSVKLLDVLTRPGMFDDERGIWEMFGSDDVLDIERELAGTATGFLTLMAGKQLFGEADDVVAKMVDAVEVIVDGLGKCKKHVWMHDGNPVARPAELATSVRVFESLADALMALSAAPDGIYLCYVKQEVSADGFFGFFLKSGGNLVSMDDYIAEAFPGAHLKSRNGRYLEGKSFDLFPYDEMIELSAPDYKGYYREYEVKSGEFSLLGFGEETCLALVLAMSCVASLFEGAVPEGDELMYLDSFLPMRTALPESPHHEIALAGGSAIVKASSSFDLDGITTESVLSGVFMPDDRRSPFKADDLIAEAVARYAGDFQLDETRLLETSRLEQQRSDGGLGEFAATEDRMKLVAYAQAREQLAERIVRGMERELDDMGGILGVRQWFERELRCRRERIASLCARHYQEHPDAPKSGLDEIAGSGEAGRLYRVKRHNPCLLMRITLNEDAEFELYGGYPLHYLEKWRGCPLSEEERALLVETPSEGPFLKTARHLLSPDGHRCNYVYLFKPYEGEDIATVLDVDAADLPFLVRTWRGHGEMFGYAGNRILDLVDPVRQIWNPLTPRHDHEHGYDFRFQIGLTKREINKLLKQG